MIYLPKILRELDMVQKLLNGLTPFADEVVAAARAR